MVQKQGQQVITCPECGSLMAATQTERGASYICGHCGKEIPINPDGVLEE